MIDFHSHILPGIDDGATSGEDTIKMIEEAKSAGFTAIISTSHYIEGYYECDVETRKKLLDGVQNNSAINLYLGSEIYAYTEMINFIANQKASTINNSHYILFEFPLNTKPLYAKELVYELIANGYKPIIAHPERYSYVKENIGFIQELVEMGALLQSNYGSIDGMYGFEAKKTVKKLLKSGLVTFMGSDVHRPNQIYPKISKILKKIAKIIPEQELIEITTLNAQKVLNDEEI